MKPFSGHVVIQKFINNGHDFFELINGPIPFEEVLKKCDMSEATFYRSLREYRLINNNKKP